MIPQRNLSLVSDRLAALGGRRIPEDVVERDYCLAWFLASLANSPLSGKPAFKGGTALKRCYFGDSEPCLKQSARSGGGNRSLSLSSGDVCKICKSRQ